MKNRTKKIISSVMLLPLALSQVLFFSACETVTNIVEDNPVLARSVLEFAVIEFIETGDTQKERMDNAADVLNALASFWGAIGDDFENKEVDVLLIREIAEMAVDWNSLTPHRALLVRTILDLAQNYAQKRMLSSSALTRSMVWREVLVSIDSAATDYLLRYSISHGGEADLSNEHLNALAIVQPWEM